jgi:hypothetical protein
MTGTPLTLSCEMMLERLNEDVLPLFGGTEMIAVWTPGYPLLCSIYVLCVHT